MIKALRQNLLLKVLSLNSISVMVSFVLGIVSTKIISFYLGTSGMAYFGSFRNFASMLRSMATLGISNSVVKLFVENKEDKKALSDIYSTFFWIFLGISGLLGILTVVLSSAISGFLFDSENYKYPVAFFGLLLPMMVINTFWIAIYNGMLLFKRIILIQVISNLIVFGLTAVLILKGNLSGGLYSFAAGELAMVIVTLLFIRKDKAYFTFSLQKIINRKYLKIISKFSYMALLSAIIAPLTIIFVRKIIISEYSIEEAGIWDAVNRLSGFYMLLFNSGLSLYYLPKLSSLKTDGEFRSELKTYFKILVPLFFIMLAGIFIFKNFILQIAFTSSFAKVNELLIWQLGGDMVRIMTLAFGYQIVVKTMMRQYFFIEIIFNVIYILLALYLVRFTASEGALRAYFYSNLILFTVIIFLFRKIIFTRNPT